MSSNKCDWFNFQKPIGRIKIMVGWIKVEEIFAREKFRPLEKLVILLRLFFPDNVGAKNTFGSISKTYWIGVNIGQYLILKVGKMYLTID